LSGKTLVGEMAAADIALTGQRHLFLEERNRGLIDVAISTGER